MGSDSRGGARPGADLKHLAEPLVRMGVNSFAQRSHNRPSGKGPDARARDPRARVGDGQNSGGLTTR